MAVLSDCARLPPLMTAQGSGQVVQGMELSDGRGGGMRLGNHQGSGHTRGKIVG